MPACAACRHENPSDSRFCNGCGASLHVACAGCGQSNPPAARFCSGCGVALATAVLAPARGRAPREYTPRHLADKILTAKSALEGERKQVTVLFADVKGSLALSEEIDPEQWHGILDGFFGVLADGVHRFEGTINQYTGDGIMALFGAPIAHEDHAQRACYAALQLRGELERWAREVKRQHGIGFSVRIGIHSGDVVVGRIGDDLRMDYTAQGHTVGLAARMQELASPDTVYLTAATQALVSGYFELDDLGEFSIRGVKDPVGAFQLRGLGAVRTRFDASRARGLTRFVGRADDMRILDSALMHAREGSSRVVGIVAEAGTGKSRLCFEFVERCRADGVRVLKGGGVAHGSNIPLLPILQVFRDYYGIVEGDSDQQIREKIAGRMLLFDEAYRDVLPILFEFFGAPDPDHPAPRMDPEARQRELFGVLRRVVQRDPTQGPVVFLIEDLHWIDAASAAWLTELVDAIGGSRRRLLIVNFRPEYEADWMQRPWYQQLPLLPLGPGAIRELLEDLLGSHPSLEGLAGAIHQRTAGNPFFTEEVVQSLVESGHLEGSRGSYRLVTPIERLEVPTTVQPLLASRIDRLPEREKLVLQTAAVIGKEFPQPILEAVAELPRSELDAALRALKAAEFIYEESLYPVAEYAFKHPLTQEVALDSQLRERRRKIHRAVAQTIEALHAGKLDEQAALLAHHWEEAAQGLVAARWHRRAAEWMGTNDIAASYRHWGRVRELVQKLPDETEAAALGAEACCRLLAMGFRLGLDPREEESLFAEGKQWAERSGDRSAEALLETAYTITRVTAGDVGAGLVHGAESQRLLSAAVDPELRALASWTASYPNIVAGRFDRARELTQQLIETTRGHPEWGFDLWNLSAFSWAHFMLGGVQAQAGDLGEARRNLERGIELCREHGDTESEGWAFGWLVEWAMIAGDTEVARTAAKRGVELAEKLGSPYSRAQAYHRLAMAQVLDGSFRMAVGTQQHGLAISRERRTYLEAECRQLAWLAEALLGAVELERAREVADEAVAVGKRRSLPIDTIYALRTFARVRLRADGADARAAVGEALDQADRLVGETGARGLTPLLLVERAELAGLEGDLAARERALREAERLFTRSGAIGHAADVARALAT